MSQHKYQLVSHSVSEHYLHYLMMQIFCQSVYFIPHYKLPCEIISLHRQPQACYKPLKVFERPFLSHVHKRLRPPARLANVDDN